MTHIRIIALIAAALLTSLASSAQFRFGVKGGLATGKLHFDKSAFDSDNRLGYVAGLQVDLGLPLGFGVSASPMFSHRNDKFYDKSTIFRRDYIEIPVHVRWGLSLAGVNHIVVPYAFTGPNFAFLCAESKDITWENRSTTTSWDVGFGVELFKHLQVQASYGIGITDAFKQVGIDKDGEVIRGKDKCWTITAAYLF